jgi:hypothetical protein
MCFLGLAGALCAVAARPANPLGWTGVSAPQVFPEHTIFVAHESGRFRVAVGPVQNGSRDVWLLPAEALDIPDLLVYAVPQLDEALFASDKEGVALPAGVRLLGPGAQASPTLFEVATSENALLLFSLGHQAVEAAVTLSVPAAGSQKEGR